MRGRGLFLFLMAKLSKVGEKHQRLVMSHGQSRTELFVAREKKTG
jgi:hypothetical protein